MRSTSDFRLAVIGLGYVGLPLAVEFARTRAVVGFDINEHRIAELRKGHDVTRELSPEELAEGKQPDLGPVLAASNTVGKVLKKGDIVVYESTVYPGATEEDCVPVLEKVSGLKFGTDFSVGYSPERINPGDKEHRF